MPVMNQQRQVLTEILVDLMRLPNTSNIVYPFPHPLSPTTAVKLTPIDARKLITQLARVDDGELIYQAYRQKIRAANIRPANIELLLSDSYLYPLTVLTGELKFAIDAAQVLRAQLTPAQLALLPEIITQRLPEFFYLFSKFFHHSQHPFRDTVDKIILMLGRIDSALEPWHITTFFNAPLFARDCVALEEQSLQERASMEGTDQCQRHGQELAEKIYPEAVAEFINVLKFSPAAAFTLSEQFSQYMISNVFLVIREQFRTLLREVFWQVKTLQITSLAAQEIILTILDGTPAPGNITVARLDRDRVAQLQLERWYVATFLSPAMHAYVMNVATHLPSLTHTGDNLSQAIGRAIAELYAPYDQQQVLRQRRHERCLPILNCVLPEKINLLETLEMIRFLNAVPLGQMEQALEQGIAVDLAQCDMHYFDFAHHDRQHHLLLHYKPQTPLLTDLTAATMPLPTPVNLPAYLQENLPTQELTQYGAKRSMVQVIAQNYLDYQNKAAHCMTNWRNGTAAAPQRRLLAVQPENYRSHEAPAELTLIDTMLQTLSESLYRLVGEPLLHILQTSPTYFPPTQPTLWNNGSRLGTSNFTLFQASATDRQIGAPALVTMPLPRYAAR